MTFTSYPFPWLPPFFGRAIKEGADASQAPIEMVAATALSAAATACQHLYDIEIKTDYRRPTALYFLTVARPGERKSAVERLFYQPHRDVQQTISERVRQSLTENQADLSLWNLKRKILEQDHRRACRKGEPTEELEERYKQHIASKPKAEVARKIIYEDTTIQALIQGLAINGRSAALVNDEFGQFINGPMASHLPQINSLWDGSITQTDRKTAESSTIVNPRLSILFQTQPSVLNQFLDKRWDEVRGNGWMARFLISFPVSTQGTRFEGGVTPSLAGLEKFNKRIQTMLNLSEPQVLRFDKRGQRCWEKWANLFESNINPNGKYANAPDFAAKAAEQIARLAGVFHAFTDDLDLEVSEETVEAAGNIIDWHGMQYLELINQRTATTIERDAWDLEEWMKKEMSRQNITQIDFSMIRMYGPNRMRKGNGIHVILDYLLQNGRINLSLHGRKKLYSIARFADAMLSPHDRITAV